MADLKEKFREKQLMKKAMSKKVARNRSIDNGGYLLKTSVFLISSGRMRRRNSTKTKSLISTGSLKAAAMAENEWWRTKLSESDVSGGLSSSHSASFTSSSRNSSTTKSTSNRQGQSNRFLPGCCSFKVNKLKINTIRYLSDQQILQILSLLSS